MGEPRNLTVPAPVLRDRARPDCDARVDGLFLTAVTRTCGARRAAGDALTLRLGYRPP